MTTLRRVSGCVLPGSLAQNIDEELYGPMSADTLDDDSLEGVARRLLESAKTRFTPEEWDGIWQHPTMAKRRAEVIAKIEKRFPQDRARLGDEGWLDFAVRGKGERKIALDWEALELVAVFFRDAYATSYHALREMLVAVREKQAMTAHMLARQMFDIATSVFFATTHLENAHVLVSSVTAEWERHQKKNIEHWAQLEAFGSRADKLNATRQSNDRSFLSDENQIIHARVARTLGLAEFVPLHDPELPTFVEKVDWFRENLSIRELCQQFREISSRCEALDKEDPARCNPIARWHQLLNRGKVPGVFSAYHSSIWNWFSSVAHGITGIQDWRLTPEGSVEILEIPDIGVRYQALLHFCTACFAVVGSCVSEVFRLPANPAFEQQVSDLESFSPTTGQRIARE